MSSDGSSKQPRTDDAYREIRDAIICGTLLPREHLVEVELAERFSISRTPIREVLQRLSVEGLVVRGRRGWHVREHVPDDIRQLYEVRSFLEGAGAFLAAQRGSDEALERLTEIHHKLVSDNAAGLGKRLAEGNHEFHAAILEAAGNTRLASLIQQNRDYAFNNQVAQSYTEDEAFEVAAQHQGILDAIIARDMALAEELSREHIMRAWQLTVSKGFGRPSESRTSKPDASKR